MVIGVDAGCLGIKDKRLQVGVFQVAFNLLLELSKIDKKNTYILYSFNPVEKSILRSFGKNMHNKVLRPSKGWMSVRLPIEFLLNKPDIFLALSQALPIYHPFKTIGFVHGLDLIKKFHTYGNSYEKLKKNTKFLLENADHIVVSSSFLKESINNTHKSKDITIVPLGVSEYFKPSGEKFRLEKPYFLFVGTLKPSKNIPRILSGFSKFLLQSKKDFYLLIIGSDFWLDKKIIKTIEKLKLENNVKILDFVKNKDLPRYYRGATAFVSPSLYEGFGIPLLEAIRSGCPVIAGNGKAEKEVLGDSGFFVNPLSVEDIFHALTYVAKNDTRNFRKKGLRQGRSFTWKKYAKGVYEIINNLAYEKA